MRGLGNDDEYWRFMNEGQLVLQQCTECRKWNWPAVFRCGDCGCWEHEWKPRDISGTIFSWTRTWHDFGASPQLGLPFVSVVVELDGPGGVRSLGVLNAGNNFDVKIGQAVTGDVIKVAVNDEEIPVIEWHLDNSDDNNCGNQK